MGFCCCRRHSSLQRRTEGENSRFPARLWVGGIQGGRNPEKRPGAALRALWGNKWQHPDWEIRPRRRDMAPPVLVSPWLSNSGDGNVGELPGSLPPGPAWRREAGLFGKHLGVIRTVPGRRHRRTRCCAGRPAGQPDIPGGGGQSHPAERPASGVAPRSGGAERRPEGSGPPASARRTGTLLRLSASWLIPSASEKSRTPC